jgi:hypothetical protein
LYDSELTNAKILFAQNTKSGVKLDDTALVNDLREISEEAANRYLEYVVLSKKSPNRAFHEDLLRRLLDAAAEQIEDDGVKYHLEELGQWRRADRNAPRADSRRRRIPPLT